MHGRYERRKPKKGKKIALIVCLVLVAVIAVGIIGGVGVFNDMLDLVKRAEVVENPDASVDEALLGNFEETEPQMPTQTQAVEETTEETTVPPTTLPYIPSGEDIINILVVGQSYREGEESRMSDTMILATVNKNTKVLTLTSFLRDAYVDMPDYAGRKCGWNRINVVYHLGYTFAGTGGAMEMMNLCLLNNFGIDVDYNVEVDFRAFSKIIDILGGVRMDLTQAEADYMNDHAEDWWTQTEFTEGEHRLFGEEALCYARMRKAAGDADSDIKRTVRQRKMIIELVKKLTRKLVSDGFDTVQEIAMEVLPMITTNMTNDEITTCIWEILPILPELTIEQGTCPVETTYWGELIDLGDAYPASVLKFYPDQNRRLMMPITEGFPSP